MGEEQIRIGELLVRSGILGEGKLNQRLDLARQLGLPLGQILIQSNDLPKEQLLNCIHVQSLILEKLISLETGVQLIKQIAPGLMSLDEALDENGYGEQHLTHRLGELLVKSGYLDDEGIAWALLTSGEIGVPLGHVLIQTSVVPPAIVGLALTLQRQIRMQSLTPDEAIERLKTYRPQPAS